MFDLSGKTALVTGAGQNVGAGIAQSLAKQGAFVAVNDFHADRAERVAREIVDAAGKAIPVPFDVTDLEAVRAGFAHVTDQVGAVDILVNNAGTAGPNEQMQVYKFSEMPVQYWTTTISVNLFGVLNCCKAAIGPMLERGWGRIITVSSAAGQVGLDIGVSTYGAAKGGATGFMRHLAVENAASGVTANTIALGFVPADASAIPEFAQGIPVGRVGDPADVGALAVYLASPESSWMTGQTLGLNGGQLTS